MEVESSLNKSSQTALIPYVSLRNECDLQQPSGHSDSDSFYPFLEKLILYSPAYITKGRNKYFNIFVISILTLDILFLIIQEIYNTIIYSEWWNSIPTRIFLIASASLQYVISGVRLWFFVFKYDSNVFKSNKNDDDNNNSRTTIDVILNLRKHTKKRLKMALIYRSIGFLLIATFLVIIGWVYVRDVCNVLFCWIYIYIV